MTSGDVGPTPRAQRTALTLDQLRRAVRDFQMLLSADERISEANAARLLGLRSDSLSRKRLDGSGPIGYGLPLGKAKITYRLSDLATWMEQHRGRFEKSDKGTAHPGRNGPIPVASAGRERR
jgi:hypothetical protein